MGKKFINSHREKPVSESEWFRVDNYFVFSSNIEDHKHGKVYQNLCKYHKRKKKNG